MFERWQAGAAVAGVLLVMAQASASAQSAAVASPEPAVEGSPKPGPQASAPDPRLLELGRHLARDCSSCHRLDGVERGIPRIAGVPAERLRAALEAYRTEPGHNPVMASVAVTLSPDEITALAAYYASLKAP